MSSRITYENKQAIQNDENVARKNKVTDSDLNEIKEVVNAHADDIENFENYDDTEITQKYNELQQENTELKKTQDDMIEKSLNKETEADTSLIVKDSDEFYGKLSVYGGHKQEKRQGYNKFNAYDVILVNSSNTSQETIESENKIAIPFNSTWARRKCTINNLKANTTYRLSCIKNGEEGINSGIWEEGNYFADGLSRDKSAKVYINISTDENGILTFFFYCNYDNVAYGQQTVEYDEIMLVEGTEEKPYEPYGVMPSLEYSSEIEAVADNVNLFDKNNIVKDYRIDSNGNNFSSAGYFISDYIDIKQYKQLVVNYNVDTMHRIALYDKEKILTRAITNSRIINIENNEAYVRICGKISDVDTMKLEKGSKATSYSKYGQGSVEISTSNKNIYDKNTMKLTKGLWIHGAKIGGNGAGWYVIVPIIGGKTITISRKVKETFYVTTTADYPAAGVAVVDTWKEVKNTNKYTMTTNEKAKYLFLGLAAASSLTNEQIAHAVDELQIEYVDKYSSYVEHRGKTYIMPIQQPMFDEDGFEKIDGVWYEKHNKVKIVFDGTENWSFNYNSAIFILDANNILTLSSAEASKLSNFIQSNTYSNKVYDTMYLEQTNGIEALNNRINIRESSCSTVAEFKTLLAQRYAENKAIYAVCRLKEPILLKCTDEQSAMLDKIDTYRDGTIITTDNNLCKIQLRYKQDLDKRISEIEKQILGGN